MRRTLSFILVLLGVVVIAYPKASEWYFESKQQQLLQAWENEFSDTLTEPVAWQVQSDYLQLTELFSNSFDIEEESVTETAWTDEADEDSAAPTQNNTTEPLVSMDKEQARSAPAPIATLIIDKINLKLPVLEGATEKNMKYAAAHMKETTPLGEIGNAAIAAHRVRTKGRLFNRLDELEVGDEIIVQQKGVQYSYTVFKTSIVEPTDVSVLNRNDKDKILTLITCDPIVNATHRLIVHAKMDEER